MGAGDQDTEHCVFECIHHDNYFYTGSSIGDKSNFRWIEATPITRQKPTYIASGVSRVRPGASCSIRFEQKALQP